MSESEIEITMRYVKLLSTIALIRGLCLESINGQKSADMLEEDIRDILHQIDKVVPLHDDDDPNIPF